MKLFTCGAIERCSGKFFLSLYVYIAIWMPQIAVSPNIVVAL